MKMNRTVALITLTVALLTVSGLLVGAEPNIPAPTFGLNPLVAQDCVNGVCQTAYQPVVFTGRSTQDVPVQVAAPAMVAAPVQTAAPCCQPVQQQYQMQTVITGYETVQVEKQVPVYGQQCVAVNQCSQQMSQRYITRTRKKIFGKNGSLRIRRANRKASRQMNGC